MLKFIAEWLSMVSAALCAAAILGQGPTWLVLAAAISSFGLAILFAYLGGKHAD